jgi:protein-disulfide isomerase
MASRSPTLAILAASWLIAASAAGEPPAAENPAAMVGATAIPWREVEGAAAADLDRAQRDHDSQVRRLELQLAQSRAKIIDASVGHLLDGQVLALEAKAEHSSPERLLARLSVAAVTDAAVSAFYEAHKRQIGRPLPAVAPQIRAFLEKDAHAQAEALYLASLRAKFHAVSLVPPLRAEVAADGPARGPADAPVTVVEFGDFQCPYCGEMEPVLADLRGAYPTQVRWVFRHLPLTSIHPQAVIAARAAVCADIQGRFWQMHDALYANQAALGEDALKGTARQIGLDAALFDQCLAGDAADDRLTRDSAAADTLGITGTPVFFINGRMINGTATAAGFRAVIDDELGRLNAPPPLATAKAAR